MTTDHEWVYVSDPEAFVDLGEPLEDEGTRVSVAAPIKGAGEAMVTHGQTAQGNN